MPVGAGVRGMQRYIVLWLMWYYVGLVIACLGYALVIAPGLAADRRLSRLRPLHGIVRPVPLRSAPPAQLRG